MMIGASKNLAATGTLSPAAAYWIPNTIMIMGSAVLLYIRSNELNFGVIDSLAALYSWLRKQRKMP